MNKYQTQQAQILEHLRHAPITTLEAREKFIMHPSGRVKELKARGFNIITQRVGKKKIARYILLSSEVQL